jgi:hypothetical protein
VRLITLHRILIGTLIAFAAFFVWHETMQWRAGAGGVALVLAILAALVAAGATWYLTNLKRFVRLDPPPERQEP